jgi:hypothetical protein
MHRVLPPNLALRPDVLIELLELREDVPVVGLIDEPREEHLASVEEPPRKRRRKLHEGRVETLEHVRVRLEREHDKFL